MRRCDAVPISSKEMKTLSELDKFRKRIDELDLEILELIKKRIKTAIEIGNLKRTMKLPIKNKNREIYVLKNVQEKINYPVKGIWKEIIKVCKEVEKC